MEKKYELTDDTIKYKGRTLHRIKASKDFNDVKKGDLGGWIEKESNLSQEGNCWVYDDSFVYGNSIIYESSSIHGFSKVNNCELYKNSTVYNSKIDNVILDGDCTISESMIHGRNIKLFDHSIIHQSSIEIDQLVLNCFNGFITNMYYNNYNSFIKSSSVDYNNYYLSNIPKIYNLS